MKNDCDFCKANACQSIKFGGIARCISRWDSKVPILHVKGGDNSKAMVLGLRDHHKENKDASSLKGVHIDLDAYMLKVKALRDSINLLDSSQNSNPGTDRQITPIFDINTINPPFCSEITDMTAFQKWLNDKTHGADCNPIITMVSSDDVSRVPRFSNKAPRLAKWHQRVAAFRVSQHQAPYSSYAVHATGADQTLAPRGENFTSLVRILDQSISADKATPVRFSLRGSIKAFYRLLARLTGTLLHMEARNVICLLASLHLAQRVAGPWYRPHLITKLKLLLQTHVIRALHGTASALTMLSVRQQMLTA